MELTRTDVRKLYGVSPTLMRTIPLKKDGTINEDKLCAFLKRQQLGTRGRLPKWVSIVGHKGRAKTARAPKAGGPEHADATMAS